jgi:serine/threonine protein kinase
MALDTGTRLGPYEIESPLGAGGMGEVYKAKDTRLDRIVAIKVLPTHMSDRPEFKDRFDREAKAISSLNHPHICALYDVGHQNGVDYLVMEYLEGETLMARLEREPLGTDKLLELGLQIAEALDRAHRSGIVHRDLKPGNIMLTREGVKLLDFGLAKLSDLGQKPGSGSLPGLTAMPTETPATPLTQEGTILGTFQYMSPEQLEGKEADTRSDIFALGAVLYEMATARKAFSGDSQASLIASIMSSEPRPISEVQGMSPPALDRVVKTCLAKDPEDRWQTAHDVALQLKWIAEGGSQAGVPAPVAARRKHRERLAWVVALAGVAASAVLLATTVLNTTEPDTQVLRYQVPIPEHLTGFSNPQISPDGRMIAFLASDSTGTGSIWIQRLNALEPQPLPGTSDASRPFWSPDSRHLAYFTAQGKLKKVNVSGGPPQTIGEHPGGSDGSWGAGGIILFDASATDSIMSIPAKGGVPSPATVIARDSGETGAAWPYFLPDGKHFLYMGMSTNRDNLTVRVGELGSLESRVLGQVSSRMEYADSGYLLYVKDGTLLAHPFDAGKAEFTGEPLPVAENVSTSGVNFQGRFSVSKNGILTYWVGQTSTIRRLVWTDRAGKELEEIGEPGTYTDPVLSPDGRHLLVAIQDPRNDTDDLWIKDLERGTTSRFTFDPADEDGGVWSPDGTRIVFTSDRSGNSDMYLKQASGAGDPVLFHANGFPSAVSDWSRDGKWIIASQFMPSGNRLDVLAFPASGAGDSVAVARTTFHEFDGQLSPEGRWIAYASMESGQWEVYVQAFPDAQGKWQVSTQGGSNPQWRDDGKEIYYLAPDNRIMAVDAAGDETFRAGVPQALFRAQIAGSPFSLNRYRVVDNGQRLLLRLGTGSGSIPPITVVKNWAAELEER